MSADFYVPRTLLLNNQECPEADILVVEGVVVVLAEPGGGKTDLLKSLSHQMGAKYDKASLFRHRSSVEQCQVLVLDALDEVAKIDQTAVDAIIVKAKETESKTVILSGRSSEWEDARTVFIEDCFGCAPKIFRLLALNQDEQRAIFENHARGENFVTFQSEVAKFELSPLLGNPQFLKLFADSYVESGRKFTSKSQIFEDAVRKLAHEANKAIGQKKRAPSSMVIAWAEEVFAKLLLSGSDGIGISETLCGRQFPSLQSLFAMNPIDADCILDTRLFRPSILAGHHEPVHRIISEYCAARYLVKRIDDASDAITLKRCLAVIAPNSVVRDELRGLVGWLSSLGSKLIQEAMIDLDPYAVLSNGDPSRLLTTSKVRLMDNLKELSTIDPYFRRGDNWRTFSTVGFFTPEIIEILKVDLAKTEDDTHLTGLLLELLVGSDACTDLSVELQTLMIDPEKSDNTRLLSQKCLLTVNDYNHRSDMERLVDLGDQTSLILAAKIFERKGVVEIGREQLLCLLDRCKETYPSRAERYSSLTSGRRYFIKSLVKKLEQPEVEWLLDELAGGLECKCGAKDAHNCDCRNGISKIIGLLLDRYFTLNLNAHNPTQVWGWLQGLNYHSEISADDSASVKLLRNNDALRQSIQHQVLCKILDADKAWDVRFKRFDWQCHAGIRFQEKDRFALVDTAFKEGNVGLWLSFYSSHNIHSTERKINTLRKHMRTQSNSNSEFLKALRTRDRQSKIDRKQRRSLRYRPSRSVIKKKRKDAEILEHNFQHLKDNRELISKGEHWGWLQDFAERYLMHPETLAEIVDDKQLPETSLQNCLHFIEGELPTLQKLAELQLSSEGRTIETVLYAACLIIFRRDGSLLSIDRKTLSVLRTNLDLHYSAVEEEIRSSFEEEVDRCLFLTDADVEKFAREYLEPQLSGDDASNTQVGWLRSDSAFSCLLPWLPFEWLKTYRNMPISAMDILFEACVKNCTNEKIVELINIRCAEIVFIGDSFSQSISSPRDRFWLIRHFFFVDTDIDITSRWLRSDPKSIFELKRYADSPAAREVTGWPTLSAVKVYKVLDTFVDIWKKVELPNSWGSGSPDEETAYRFLNNIVWAIGKDTPERSLPVLKHLIDTPRFRNYSQVASSMHASSLRQMALRDFEAPSPENVVELLDSNKLAIVEDLRAFLIEVLEELQQTIFGGEFDSVEKFYTGGRRVDENTASQRIAEHLEMRLSALSMSVTIEQHFKNSKRCDITAAKMFEGSRSLVVVEVKGQWHTELYTAAEAQLFERYSTHPDAGNQGIYLVLWFGEDEKVAGRKTHRITSPSELRTSVMNDMPDSLRNMIDVFVLDLSKKPQARMPQ
tara:strand:- start:6 stop:4049 length:4044 start_codon:yes stop_codon:yes gene_type:complete